MASDPCAKYFKNERVTLLEAIHKIFLFCLQIIDHHFFLTSNREGIHHRHIQKQNSIILSPGNNLQI